MQSMTTSSRATHELIKKPASSGLFLLSSQMSGIIDRLSKKSAFKVSTGQCGETMLIMALLFQKLLLAAELQPAAHQQQPG